MEFLRHSPPIFNLFLVLIPEGLRILLRPGLFPIYTNLWLAFNQRKGSIPARTDVALDEFDSCAQTSAADMASTSEGGSLLPSYAHGMALFGAQAGAITDVVTAHFNSDMSSADAVQQLATAVANSM